MTDRENVIKAFEICNNNEDGIVCKNCPYKEDKWNGAWEDETGKTCFQTLHADVLALLKEQEAKTGYWIDSAGNDKCSICGEEYSDLYPDYGNTHFCPNCGAKMKGR